MQIAGEHTYPYPVDAVFSILTDPDHILARHRFMGARNVRMLVHEQQEDDLVIQVAREVPAEVPHMLRKIIAEWNPVRQTERWTRQDNTWQTTLAFELKGIPVELQGTQTLEEHQGQTLHRVTLSLRCPLPIIGRKVADFMAVRIRDTLQGEFAHTENALRERGGAGQT